MGNAQRHRGQQSDDAKNFHPDTLPALRRAVADFSWLLSQGYSDGSATLSLVGDRYRLTARQRQAVMRAACSDQALALRKAKEIDPDQLSGQAIAIDGYNFLITVESGLSGGIVLECRDSAWRDVASIHGTYRQVEETVPAIRHIAAGLNTCGVTAATWFLDAPVSNSGRLRQLLLAIARDGGLEWQVHIVNNPDKQLAASGLTVVSSDGWVMEQSAGWCNLSRRLLLPLQTVDPIRFSGQESE